MSDLSKGCRIGWFQGRMEFGPRALGGRSIIADPRSETMQKTLNLKVKFRESLDLLRLRCLEKMLIIGLILIKIVLTC